MKWYVTGMLVPCVGVITGCASLHPIQGVDTNTMNLAVQRGDTVLYIKHAQVVPTEAVKHDAVTAGIQANTVWAELGAVLVGELVDSATEIAKSQNETRAKTISNGTEILAVGFNSTNQQSQLMSVIREAKDLINVTTLKDAVVGPRSAAAVGEPDPIVPRP